jgi:hypothetical protein
MSHSVPLVKYEIDFVAETALTFSIPRRTDAGETGTELVREQTENASAGRCSTVRNVEPVGDGLAAGKSTPV